LDDSIDDLKKAVGLKPENDSAHNNLGLSYFEKEEYEDALNEFTKAIGLKPHGLHYNNRGLALYHIGNLQDAKKDFDAALEKTSDDPFIYYNRGNVYMNLGEFDKAHADFDKGNKLDLMQPKFWHAKGLAYEAESMLDPKNIRQDLQEKALEMFQKAIEVADNFMGSRLHLGLMYHRLARFDKALICFSQVLDKMPTKDKTVFIARGLVY
jgi:tetratricopeptide (TPR) repeat protein